MSVLKMKFINIVGPLKSFDNMIIQYIINNNIQLEHALSSLESIRGLSPFMDENPYELLMNRLIDINDYMGIEFGEYKQDEIIKLIYETMAPEEVNEYINKLEEKLKCYREEIEHLNKEIKEREQIKKQLLHILDLDVDINKLFHLDFIKFRFGKISKDNYKKLNMYIRNVDVIVVPIHEENEEVWISYFMPVTYAEKIDTIFSSLYFERIHISEKVEGTPKVALGKINQEIAEMKQRIKDSEKEFLKFLEGERKNFAKVYRYVGYLNKTYEVRKYAAHTMESFYIVGWVPEKDIRVLTGELDRLEGVTYAVEEPEMVDGVKPPTKLNNNKFFKPFETIVTMYGLPSHNEVDPTVIVALSYILMFGAMFGDLGQGAILTIVGILIKRKGNHFGGILTSVGASSMVFGLVYGSFFGNEEIITNIFHNTFGILNFPIMSPMHNINALLYISVGFGVFMIFLALFLNIINCIKIKDYGKLFFDKNGVAGLLFYSGLIFFILYFIIEGHMFASILLVLLFSIVPLLLILFKEPLENLIQRKKEIFPEDKGGYFVEGFFELFETVLGFLSNTISFVRVGAFALNHAGLSLAVWTLYHMADGAGSIVVIIFGNALIIGLEGLIVGIQCLRLQYYEMFSRFFNGEGRQFDPLSMEKD